MQVKGPKRSIGMLQHVFVSYWLKFWNAVDAYSKTLCWFANSVSHLHNDFTE